MENIDPLDRRQEHDTKEDHSQVQQPVIKREMDSLDDFEHLGHDSSPLKEEQKTVDLLDLRTESPGGEVLGVINKGSEIAKAATQLTDDVAAAAAHFDRSIQEPRGAKVDNKMDSNLLEMGDTLSEGIGHNDDKLDKFLSGKTEEVADKELISDFKSATKNFMDMERELIQSSKNTSDLLDRYSDSESDAEQQFKQPESTEKKGGDFKVEPAFKDVEDFSVHPPPTLPEIPKQDIPKPQSSTPPPQSAPVPISKPVENIIQEVSQCVKKEPEVKKAEPTPPARKVEKTKSDIIEAEAMFCKMGLDAWFNPERLNPKVENLIYWRDPKKTGPIFGGVLVVLLALTYFSFISVAAYLSLFALTGTISFRIYKNIVQAVQKTGDGHPFKEFLEYDISLPKEKVKEVSEVAVSHANAAASELRRLFLVEDLVDSIKFGVLLWCLTYLGSWFNGMTLIIIAWVALFTLPKVYEANKTQIDKNLDIVRTKFAEITSKVKAAIPIGKKEEKKEQ